MLDPEPVSEKNRIQSRPPINFESQKNEDPEPTSEINEDPKPTHGINEDPEPTHGKNKDPEPTSEKNEDPKPTHGINEDPKPTPEIHEIQQPTSEREGGDEKFLPLSFPPPFLLISQTGRYSSLAEYML